MKFHKKAEYFFPLIYFCKKLPSLQFLKFIKTDFMLVRGQALPLYMPKRYTEDWDILIRPQDTAKIQQEFKQQQAIATGNLAIGGVSYQLNNQDIDILECQETC